MKGLGIGLLILISSIASAQSNTFPATWIGHWKGELLWYRTGTALPKKVNMELNIQPTDTADVFTWQLVYGSKSEDYRPYILKPIDKKSGHWVIDELSGIVLDQYWVGQRFSGAFTVQKATIMNSYWIENENLHIEFFSLGAKPMTTTGKGTEDVPFVDSYKLGSYQQAVLTKTLAD